MTNELPKCGCGGEPTESESRIGHIVICQNRKCFMQTGEFPTAPMARAAWRKAMSRAPTGAVEALRDALEQARAWIWTEESRGLGPMHPTAVQLFANIDAALAAPPSAQEGKKKPYVRPASHDIDSDNPPTKDYSIPPSSPSGQPGREVPRDNRWRKKPVVIEAMQYTGGESWRSFMRPADAGRVYGVAGLTRLVIETLEGKMFAEEGDWIIRGVKEELYPCKPDIFAATYEPASASPAVVTPQGAEVNAGMERHLWDLSHPAPTAPAEAEGAQSRWQIFNDGRGRWVLVDNESDDPCPVYRTRGEALRIAQQNEAEAKGGV